MSYPDVIKEKLTLPILKKYVDKNGTVMIDFLFPNGIILPASVSYYSPLDQIKQIVWREVLNYPLASQLKQIDCYHFFYINSSGYKEEVTDESLNLEQLQPFIGFFQVVERKGDHKSQIIHKMISNLIGRGIQKQESFHAAEIAHFQSKMSDLCKEIASQRRAQTPLEKFMWKYPLRLLKPESISFETNNRGKNCEIAVDVYFYSEGNCKLTVNLWNKPEEAVRKVLLEMNGSIKDSELFILKVIGHEEYLYGDFPLIQFKYIYQCLVKRIAPQFWMVLKSSLPESRPPVPKRPTMGPISPLSPTDDVHDRSESIYVTEIKAFYKIQLLGLSNVTEAAAGVKIILYIGLYHGAEALCKVKSVDDLTFTKGSYDEKKDFYFDIRVADLPLAARLCFAIYCLPKDSKNEFLAYWVNIPVYDFKDRLQRGEKEILMWQYDQLQQPEDHCHVMGGVSVNSGSLDSAVLKISYPEYDNSGVQYVTYPPYDKVLQCAAENMEAYSTVGSPTMKVSKSHLEQLAQVLRSPEQLCEQDMDLIWTLRYEVQQNHPTCLSKVLQSVKWNSYIDVAKMTALLQTWKLLPVDYALEILDYEYPDHNVRKFAVRCLDEDLSDDDVSQYLLQLVQALKYETRLYSPLAEFLLTRALKNQHLGHKLFWLLRSELHNPQVSTQYSQILQVYLKHNFDHLQVLARQHEALKKLAAVNSLIKACDLSTEVGKKIAKKLMNDMLSHPNFIEHLKDLSSPLSPLYKMNELQVAKCRFMTSKKRPLYLVWSNEDSMGADIQILYKNGDDLRQDMLTLQILQVMDNIWQAKGLDFRMNPYMCMATDQMQGMIEVVTNAETLANIQNKSVFKADVLLNWLKEHHKNEESLDAAIDEFTMSCAGYCVATYVLGIGDRHNDNIMVKTSGQIFHIDFGHFLGNFKTKFNVKRERVPFVLTNLFVHVINKGGANPKNFIRFQKRCEDAFCAVREKFPLLNSLFMMMLSGGIPQLTSPKDVNYLREALVPHYNQQEARDHFRSKFHEALKGSWTVAVNNYFHMLNKNGI